MESIFVINKFECGWDITELTDDIYTQEAYCIEALEIPDEKICSTEMIANGLLEVVLSDIDKREMNEDWYINLARISV